MRGGSFDDYDINLQASVRYGSYPSSGYNDVGFRVSEVVPEPSSIVALACGLGMLLELKRRKA